jgi:hypothetical protein
MSAKFDPNIELSPNPILIFAAILVFAGFGTVAMIILTGDSKPAPTAAAEQ